MAMEEPETVTDNDGVPAAPGGAVYSERCQQCGAQLRIVDDLPVNADVAQSFRGTIAESFVVVPDCDPEELNFPNGGQTLSNCPSLEQVSIVEKIMALASGQTEQDHPVCSECLKNVIAEVQRQVDEAEADHRQYEEAYSRMQERLGAVSDDEADRLEAEIAEMEAEEKRLLEELAAYDREEAEIREEEKRQQRQEEQLQREEEEFWITFAARQLDVEGIEEERAATASAIEYAKSELNRLKRANVLNDMFHIAPLEQFGTINKFRLGTLPEKIVSWEEINAAWGQACLLLDAIIKRCGIPQVQHRLLPRGSFSCIQVGGQEYPLYCSHGGLTSFFQKHHFDCAMSSFLECLKEVTRFLQRDPSMKLPFKIEGDKVAGFSVQALFNQGERWTKALKYMLTDLKWIIAFVESREYGGGLARAA